MNTYDLTIMNICDFGLCFRMDGFRILYVCIATFMWLMSMSFSREYMAHYSNKLRYYIFSILTYVATVGVFVSADLITTFLFFEIMSFTSYVWVVQDERKESLKAGETYLAIAVMGGLVMLMGLMMLYNLTGTLRIDALNSAIQPYLGTKELYVTGCLILFGFGAKAGAFPLHIWLPKAHPVAPAPASALLSGVLTKAGIFGVLVISCEIFAKDVKWGTLILGIGVITMFLGAVLALFSVDLKRTLACSSVSQIGFILVGIGMQDLLANENMLAVRGTLLHMVNHSMIKLCLFMAAGVVYMNLHALDLNEIRGFGRKKPLFKGIFLMGALGIGGIPLFNGYISKTLLHEAIVEYTHAMSEGHVSAYMINVAGMKTIEWIFIISGGLTVCYMTKLFVAVFIEKNASDKKQKEFDDKKDYMNPLSAVALTLSAVYMPVSGMLPTIVSDGIADLGEGFMHAAEAGARVHYFSGTNLIGAMYSIVIGALLYLTVVRKLLMKDGEYVDRWPKFLDLENSFYRPLLLIVLPNISVFVCRFLDRIMDYTILLLRKTIYKDAKLPIEPTEGDELTHYFGGIADDIIRGLNENVLSYHPMEPEVEHKLAIFRKYYKENTSIIGRSMSFGLFLACTGLLLVLAYMLLF
ncbi:MAG: NADH dehydrogenase [Lachnospiraceae bacterium]|nr:NADH dehydrogenase [Lachnospiraceae bacterium]